MLRHSWASLATICAKYFAATRRDTFAVTFGLPSRSDPIQLPGRKNAGHTGGTLPASSPSTQSSKRRYTCGTVSNSVLSKMSMMVSASSRGVGFLSSVGEVRTSASISCGMWRSFSRRADPPR